jgi:hypothetical protein
MPGTMRVSCGEGARTLRRGLRRAGCVATKARLGGMKRRERRPIRRRIPRFVAIRLPRAIAGLHARSRCAGSVEPPEERPTMKTLIALLLWCVLFVLCWPLALLALVLWPLAWLVALPFRLVGTAFAALFAFLGALFMLPARLLRGPAPHVAA